MVIDPAAFTPDRSLRGKLKRRLTYWRTARPLKHTPKRGVVCFTFDDFPRSAAEHGAEALAAFNLPATYYVCTGMRGHTNVMGEMYCEETLAEIVRLGHEVGAHTHSHLDCSQVDPAIVRQEITDNLDGLTALGQRQAVAHFAWPYGETTFQNKSALDDLVSTARGILPGINREGSDLMQLSAFELTPEPWTTERAVRAIEKTARTGGWTIIFTHDIQRSPSPFGTTPEAFKHIVKLAHDADVDVRTMSGAFAQIQTEAL